MINKDKLIKSAMTAFLVLTTQTVMAASSSTETTATENEKCYGLVKAGKNDCATAKASCAGSSTKDGQADAYVFMPKGLCEKLVGGKLKPETDSAS